MRILRIRLRTPTLVPYLGYRYYFALSRSTITYSNLQYQYGTCCFCGSRPTGNLTVYQPTCRVLIGWRYQHAAASCRYSSGNPSALHPRSRHQQFKPVLWIQIHWIRISMVRRGSVGSASACWKAGPSSILGSAPKGGLSHWAYKRWGDRERPRRMYCMNVIGWLYVCYKIWKINKKSGILPPNLWISSKFGSGSMVLMTKNWKNIAEKIYLFCDQKLQFTYP